MKFTKKSKATIITLLALTAITPTVSTVKPVIVNAKAETVTVHKKSQFKKGYKYKYNKKKHVYIGHKIAKKRVVQKATSNYDVPKISNFTDNILNKYNLLDQRWAKTTLTYNDNKLSNKQQTIVEDAINQINNLNIVKLIKTNKGNANLTFALKDRNNGRDLLGNADTEDTGQTYHGLFVSHTSKITFFTDELNKPTVTNYTLTLNKLTIHEVGHALGLDHNLKDKSAIMYHIIDTDNIQTIDSTHVAIDQDYINRLAILYQN